MADHTLADRIKNRDSWLRVGVVSAVTFLLLWKLATADVRLDNFDFSDLLSLLLSLFAVSLSVAFYFKATETSNSFYDNTFKFTKDLSEILGRIEAGFGERLRHLDEGYSGLRDSFARLPLDTNATNQALKEGEEAARKFAKENQDLIAQLADRAKLPEQERKEFFAKLSETAHELRKARTEVSSLKRQLEGAQTGGLPEGQPSRLTLVTHVSRYLSRPERLARLRPGNSPITLEGLREHFPTTLPHWPRELLEDLRRLNYLDESMQLTERGARWMRNLLIRGEHRA
jgi:hypothetical protein